MLLSRFPKATVHGRISFKQTLRPTKCYLPTQTFAGVLIILCPQFKRLTRAGGVQLEGYQLDMFRTDNNSFQPIKNVDENNTVKVMASNLQSQD